MANVKRPGVVSFIGVLLYIKGALAVVMSIASFIAKGTPEAEALGLSESSLLTSGIAEAIAAVLLFAAAFYLMSGSKGARTFVAVVVGIRLVATIWVMLTHHVGGFLWTGLISAGFSLFILWALYGDDRSEEYFEQTG